MTVATKPKMRDLGTLEIKKPVRVMMLPSEASGVIINYSCNSALRVTCSFKEASRNVRIGQSKKRVKIKTPPLLFSVSYADLPTPYSDHINNFYVYGFYDKDKKAVWAAPYVLSNVYSRGRICFGRLHPKDLRAAYNIFWEASFNGELANMYINGISYEPIWDTRKFVKGYQKKIFDHQDWEDFTPEICGRKYIAIKNPTEALLITKNKELLKQVPKKYWLKQGDQPMLILQAKRYPDFWMFANEKIKFKLARKSEVVTGNLG